MMKMAERKITLDETHVLCNVANYIRNLLCCDGAGIALRCFDSTLAHPQLARIFSLVPHQVCYYGSLTDRSLLSDERVWAACDMAIQTRTVRCLDTLSFKGTPDGIVKHTRTKCLLIVPLECSFGIIGVLLCTSTKVHAFGEGEYRLLYQSLSTLVQRIETSLYTMPSLLPTTTGKWITDAPMSMLKNATSGDMHGGESVTREQNELLTMVSHDLRTPLSVIKGYVSLLQTYGFADSLEQNGTEMTIACRQRYLNSVMEQINHLEVLINDLLEVSRLHSGRLKVSPAPVDLPRLCQRVAQQLQDRIDLQESGHYCIQCVPEPDLPMVWADVNRVQQVLINLVENAVKYSPAGGLIEIYIYERRPSQRRNQTTSSASSHLAVTVRDYGIGIPVEHQETLFNPFKRLDRPETQHIAGNGIGLYIVRRLIWAMNGRIMLKSQEGKGTSVTFTLPIAIDALSHPYSTMNTEPTCVSSH
jgi:two-component system, OmpR family, sensor histidine kinase VicK